MLGLRIVVVSLAAGAISLALASQVRRQTAVEVHEWGTFTSLQDENGAAIGGINTDDEAVPWFVYEIQPDLVGGPTDLPATLAIRGKGVVSKALPEVTMRLETPVLYFHLPARAPALKLDVEVGFPRGWLTQYYPRAVGTAPGLASSAQRLDPAGGTLRWQNLQVGDVEGSEVGPVTQDRVWTAPREVEATAVKVPKHVISEATSRVEAAETERFLFYRGIGHLDSPMRVVRRGPWLEFENNTGRPLEVGGAWLADIREDGVLAFREVGAMRMAAEGVAGRTEAEFEAADYSPGNLEKLRAGLRAGLETQGLNWDEAEALLNTWEHSYFKSPGLRLLYLVPQEWTDGALPLAIRPAGANPKYSMVIRRAMIGRIEIVTPGQRGLLEKIAASPASDAGWIKEAMAGLSQKDPATADKLREGKIPLSAIPVKVPGDYAAYLALGRFRQALVLEEEGRRPTAGMEGFIKAYGLEPWGAAR